jgi:saccharopine dehydrogenase-like NADP-dependent oxidoreductase
MNGIEKEFPMHKVLLLGAGKVGPLIATLLANSADYKIYLGDLYINSPHLQPIAESSNHLELVTLDARDPSKIAAFIRQNDIESLISALPYYCNEQIVQIAKDCGIHYFDLTEDQETAAASRIAARESKTVFAPQCGLAPGFISIVAHDLMQHFPELNTVKMRVGALPLNVSNTLQYFLTWSTDGLINEYGNLCEAIVNGDLVKVFPLDDLEEIKIDGLTYEAFNTSGGIGSLVRSYAGKLKQLSYKTIRYPGHCDKMRFLMNDLNLNLHRETLKHILESVLPKTTQDVVLVYVSVNGIKNQQFIEEHYVKKFYSNHVNGIHWSALQLATASSLCAVFDIVTAHPERYSGFVRQEDFLLGEITTNRFGKFFK